MPLVRADEVVHFRLGLSVRHAAGHVAVNEVRDVGLRVDPLFGCVSRPNDNVVVWGPSSLVLETAPDVGDLSEDAVRAAYHLVEDVLDPMVIVTKKYGWVQDSELVDGLVRIRVDLLVVLLQLLPIVFSRIERQEECRRPENAGNKDK